jgi:hypothetical protein
VRRVPARPKSGSTRTFDELIAPYPRDVQALARRARAWMKKLLPKTLERVDATGPFVSYGYAPGYKGIVSYLTVNQKGIKVGVAYGSAVPDPHHLLEGSGKSARHVAIRTVEQLASPGLSQLVLAGLAAWKKDHA